MAAVTGQARQADSESTQSPASNPGYSSVPVICPTAPEQLRAAENLAQFRHADHELPADVA